MDHWHAEVHQRESPTADEACFHDGPHPKQSAVGWIVSKLDRDESQKYGVASHHRTLFESLLATRDMPDDWAMEVTNNGVTVAYRLTDVT